MSTTNPVRFAIVSPARWGRLLLDAARVSDKLHFVGVASRNPENAADIVQTYGGRAFAGFEALLADPEVEAVLLPTPHFLHYPQTMAALAAGKHVFVEKPIANSLDEARAMQQAAEARGLKLMVGLMARRSGGIRKAKELLDAGDLGQVALAVVVHGAWIAPRDADDWKHAAEAVPGGPLDQLGVHYADVLCYLFGPVRQVSGFYRRDVTPSSAPDSAIGTFQFESGAIAVYATQQVSAYASQLTIYGTKGALHVNRMGQDLLWQELVDPGAAKVSGPSLSPIPFDGPPPFTGALTEELEELADAIRSGRPIETGAQEGIESLRMMRAVMEAHDSGQAVVLTAAGAPA